MKKQTKKMRHHREYLQRWLENGVYAGGHCDQCGEKLILLFRHDAVCCPACNQWLDKSCSDPECPYCSGRPATPAECLEATSILPDKNDFIRRYEKRLKGKRIQKKRLKIKKGGIYDRQKT